MKLSPLSLAFAAGVLAADGEFITTCDANTLKVTGSTLTAQCRDILGTVSCSRLDLSKCLKNSYGNLSTDPVGAGYVASQQITHKLTRHLLDGEQALFYRKRPVCQLQ